MAFTVSIFNEGFDVSTFSEGIGPYFSIGDGPKPSPKVGTAKPSLKS